MFVQYIVKNGGSVLDAFSHDRSDGSMDEAVEFWDRATGRNNFGGKINMGRPIVTNEDFLLLGIPIAPLTGFCWANS